MWLRLIEDRLDRDVEVDREGVADLAPDSLKVLLRLITEEDLLLDDLGDVVLGGCCCCILLLLLPDETFKLLMRFRSFL